MRHKHADLIHAWAEGAEIEFKVTKDVWAPMTQPNFVPSTEYRIKPQNKPDVVKYGDMGVSASGRFVTCTDIGGPTHANCKFTFDGDTGKLIKAEVL